MLPSILFLYFYYNSLTAEEERAVKFIDETNLRYSKLYNLEALQSWNYETNLTETNKEKLLQQQALNTKNRTEIWKLLMNFRWEEFRDPQLKRQFHFFSIRGDDALPEDKLKNKSSILANMVNIFSTSKICPFNSNRSCNLSLEPELNNILLNSTNYEELSYVWKAWRDAAGKPTRHLYKEFIDLSNEAARLNGFEDAGAFLRYQYESSTFQKDLKRIWNQVRPLYQQLHAYVRRKLIQIYGSNRIKSNGPIPAQLLGAMHAEEWGIYQLVKPFPNKPSIDVTPQIKASMSTLQMVELTEQFFISLGLKPMREEFWNNSIFEKPVDRDFVCHASAEDFCDGKDFRIKMCMEPTMDYLLTIHHEMGHIQYYMQYADQPFIFRTGANPGFHEAIGDAISLSVRTPTHLKAIGLLTDVAIDRETDINFLLQTALPKVAFLPYGYILDHWRWQIYSGDYRYEEWNTKWWELRLRYQGLCPPVKRTDSDFDPGSKFHVANDIPFIRYFVSFIVQFQFHEALCRAAGFQGPLHRCDIYKSKDAGRLIRNMMEMGASRRWQEAMYAMTGSYEMRAEPILRYFNPLFEWLKKENENETIGWESADPTICP